MLNVLSLCPMDWLVRSHLTSLAEQRERRVNKVASSYNSVASTPPPPPPPPPHPEEIGGAAGGLTVARVDSLLSDLTGWRTG